MITLEGKYNTAEIMIDLIDDSTRAQIQSFLNHPAFNKSHIAVMPDCHAGKGSVVGYTATLNDYLIPFTIGVDIGCGVLSYCLGRLTDFGITQVKLDEYIKKYIPHGFAHRSEMVYSPDELPDQYHHEFCLTIGRLELDITKVLQQIGTLGGGNHFIEVEVSQDGTGWLTIHTGSRNFGLQVANYHQKVAKNCIDKVWVGNEYKQSEWFVRDSEEGKSYVHDMKVAQEFATMNRHAIAKDILENVFGWDSLNLDASPWIESVHNYIDFKDKVIRKGAVSAHAGEKLLIPFNPRDGMAICTGKGNSRWNYSAPHGAGRIMSRTEARKTLSGEIFALEMKNKGIYTTTANNNTVDESPEAYKGALGIIMAIADTVTVDDLVVPVYNFKSESEE